MTSIATHAQHVPDYKRAGFQQSIDAERPHTLLTPDTRKSGTLRYRYDDSLEEIEVPNIWYNQPYMVRVEMLGWQAEIKEEAADRYVKYPPIGQSAADVAIVVEGYRAQAARIRAEATRMEMAGSATHPVAASKLRLNLS